MARSQMITSKNPMTGAIYFNPFAMKMTLIVPRLTSQMRKKNIRSGKITHAKKSDDATGSAIALPPFYGWSDPPAIFQCGYHPPDCNRIPCLAHWDVVSGRKGMNRPVGINHLLFKPGLYLLRIPVVEVEVLYHLKIRDDYSSPVAKDIGKNRDSPGLEQGIRIAGDGPICEFGNEPCLHPAGVVDGDHILKSGRDKDIDIKRQQFLVCDIPGT